MDLQKDLNTPFTYNDWLKYKSTLELSSYQSTYAQYLSEWYKKRKVIGLQEKNSLKEDYIQLLKDLSFVFGKSKEELFLSQIDFDNDEDIVYAIPFFVRKLKEIASVLSYKRETVKRARQKHSLIGSNFGVEKLLYEYILKGFTKDENYISQIPISMLSNALPALSSVNGTFFIELEELHDSQTYLDSDPSVSIQEYADIEDIANEIPFEDLTEDELLGLLSTKYMSRVADTPLSRIFFKHLSEVPSLSTLPLLNNQNTLIYNQIAASEKYLGENVYGLTAVRVNELEDNADLILGLNITQGNNWFHWPSGDKVIDTTINNVYIPITLNESNFVKSGATGGDDYTNSDLFFSDKIGDLQGAWLQGPRIEKSKGNVDIVFSATTEREMIFPYVGFEISTKGTRWGGFSLNDRQNDVFEKLADMQKDVLLKEYYTRSLPNSASVPIYLNDTRLVYDGAFAELFSDNADTITKRTLTPIDTPIYNSLSSKGVDSQEAYLYKFLKTDIPISMGTNSILWPIQRLEGDTVPITVLDDTCLPIYLNKLDVATTMPGAIAGFNPETSDIIYKLNTKNEDASEAAWLGSASLARLVSETNIKVYDSNSSYCASYIDGPIQPGLHTKVLPRQKASFIWMGEDTYADEVVFYRKHQPDCPYIKGSPHNYYKNQDYLNENPLENVPAPWSKCRCKSINFSPIGHSGNSPNDFNRMADFLFADPQGSGENFAFNSWLDTRGFNPLKSPQFSYYKLDGKEGDNQVGWGSGSWVTGAKTRMVLKTGRRYTYIRSSLKQEEINTSSINYPYLILNHPYKRLSGYTSPGSNDFVFLIDKSYTQRANFDTTLKIVNDIANNLLTIPSNSQVAMVAFDQNAIELNFLTKNKTELRSFTFGLGIGSKPKNIYNALIVASYILNTNINTEASSNIINNQVLDLCSSLDEQLYVISNNKTIRNNPNPSNAKNIVVISDGYENLDIGKAVPYSEALQKVGINVYALDIGTNSSFLDTMENLTIPENYFNVQRFLRESDYDINWVSNWFCSRFSIDLSITPTWYKMVKNISGAWLATTTPSDMVIHPGDYLSYIHRGGASYADENQGEFIIPSISFAMNVDLYGWDYANNRFSNAQNQTFVGAKPFWGKTYNYPEESYDQHFDKQVMSYGGQVRFIDDYVPIHQPEVSDIVLENGNFLKYNRKGFEKLNWIQPLNFNVYLSSYEWKKLNFYKGYSNLEDLFRTNNPLDLISYATTEPSDIVLEGYSSFINSKYNYFARNSFKYTEKLYLISRCYTSFAIVNTAIEIQAIEPYANILNINYPTVATISYPSMSKTEKELGKYMLYENLGTSTWRGRGYDIDIDLQGLSEFDKLSSERMFLSLDKFSARNRGLTKKDQKSPVIINNIDSRWMFKAYQFSSKSGMIDDILNNQKFTPYQSSYEIIKRNDLGVARITDDFDFWNIPPLIGNWDSPKEYPLTFRKELPISSYESRKNLLMTEKGDMTEWKTDIYGNNYGLFKFKDDDSNSTIKKQINSIELPNQRF